MQKSTSGLGKLICETVEENQKFLSTPGGIIPTWEEVIELVMDVIDQLEWLSELNNRERVQAEFALPNFVYLILMPLSFGIMTDLLVGNLTACFTQLRTILEQLAKCCAADRTQQPGTFDEKLRLLEEQGQSLTAIIRSIDPTNGEAVKLWRTLSERWVHVRGLTRIIETAGRPGPLALNLIVPMPLTWVDQPELRELEESIASLRRILASTLNAWKTLVPM